MTDRHSPTRPRLSAGALALVVLLAAVASVATAAGPTTVSLSAANGTVEAGETTRVDVVVENADGGVGALNLTVAVSDPARVRIESVELHGDPGVEHLGRADDGSSVTINTALANTSDTGDVTVATLEVRGERPGRAALDVAVETLGDERGVAYTVERTEGATLSVNGADSAADAGREETAGQDAASGMGTDPATGAAAPTDGKNGASTAAGENVDAPDATATRSHWDDLPGVWVLLLAGVAVVLLLAAIRL